MNSCTEGAEYLAFFFSSRRRHTRCYRDWSSDVCSSDLARCHPRRLLLLLPRGCLLLRGDRRRPGVVRRSQAGGLRLFDMYLVCACLLKAVLFNLCLYSDIVASADSFVFELMYLSPSRP